MYILRSTFVTILVAIAMRAVSATPLLSAPRDDDSQLSLVGPQGDCINMQFKGNRLSATCVALQGFPNTSSTDLNKCIGNQDGIMAFRAL